MPVEATAQFSWWVSGVAISDKSPSVTQSWQDGTVMARLGLEHSQAVTWNQGDRHKPKDIGNSPRFWGRSSQGWGLRKVKSVLFEYQELEN